MSAEVDGVRRRVILTDYRDIKAYRESKDKHPRGLDEEEEPDLCFGCFFLGKVSKILHLFEAGKLAALVI